MFKKITVKFLSVLLCILTITSVTITSITSSSAAVGSIISFLGTQLLQSCCRGVYKVSNLLTEDINVENQQAIRSVTKYCISYESRVTYEVKEMCQEILDEIKKINDNITTSTNYISTQINNGYSADVKETFLGENGVWYNDVTAPINNNGLGDVYENFTYYFVANALYSDKDLLKDTTIYNAVKSKWPSLIKNTIDENTIKEAEDNLDKAFYSVVDKGANKDQVYTSSIVNSKFINAIDKLSSNFTQKNQSYNKGKTSVKDAAATCAYYYFPYSYQQYNFIKSEMQNQIMVTTVLTLAYNEFLAKQGEYLSSRNTGDWCDEVQLKHTSTGDNNYIINQTYNELKQGYLDQWTSVLKRIIEMYNSPIHINASSFNGEYSDIETSLNKYMTEEDFATVDLKIQGYVNSINYYSDVKPIANKYSLKIYNTKSNSQYIPSTLKFNRIQTGVNGDVYYILEPNQFNDKNALNIGNMMTRIVRKNMFGIDSTIGDLYEVSCDYVNLTKQMSDGVNKYSCPKDLNGSLASLFNTPTYSSKYSNTPAILLSEYLPAKASNGTFLLSSNYNNNFGTKITYMNVHSGDITMSNLYNQAPNSKYFSIDSYNCDDYYCDSNSNYSLILSNNNSDGKYYQKARLSGNDTNALEDATIEYNNNSYASETSIEAGSEITIKFKFNNDIANFVSLKCMRNNSTTTETILIDGEDELNLFYNEKTGYYEYTTYMPYSDTTFYFESNKDSINYTINDYDDLCMIANKINSGNERYISGNFVLANDIDCESKNWVSIGTSDYSFCGTFDGQGHTIKNLNINSDVADGNKNGLFKRLGEKAVIKNLVMQNAYVFTNEEDISGSGAIAKQNNGTISNCLVTNSNILLGNYDYLGGIVGLNNGTIENCGVANSTISHICSGYSSKTMGGITEVNKGSVKNCYTYNCRFNNGTACNAPIIASGNIPTNCYYYTPSTVSNFGGIKKTVEQFKSGEVAYCLNSGVTDGSQSWYQNIDNGIGSDAYPVISNNGNNTVYKSNTVSKPYSNS